MLWRLGKVVVLALELLATIAITGIFSATAVGMRRVRKGITFFVLAVTFSSVALLLTIFQGTVSDYLISNSSLSFDQVQYASTGLAGTAYIVGWIRRV